MLSDWFPALATAAITVLIIVLVRWVLQKRLGPDASETHFQAQIAPIVIALLGLLVVIFVLPDGSDSDLAFSLFGLIVTGALAISSQSIIANAMAGLMLRSVSSFKPGDFIEVQGQMGRVTERGLFHTEIQTADRDLITLPNAIMVNQPVRVVRASGTIVSATASIGYDVSRHELEDLFVKAAESAELVEPFVQVVDLGDYSVNYRIAGFLEDPRSLLAARSRLRSAILDTLSEAEIEIMSPSTLPDAKHRTIRYCRRALDHPSRLRPAEPPRTASSTRPTMPRALTRRRPNSPRLRRTWSCYASRSTTRTQRLPSAPNERLHARSDGSRTSISGWNC